MNEARLYHYELTNMDTKEKRQLRCTWELINEWTYEFPGLEGTWKVIFLYFDEI